jgi:tetratricopeptide (TPR) repeat protein
MTPGALRHLTAALLAAGAAVGPARGGEPPGARLEAAVAAHRAGRLDEAVAGYRGALAGPIAVDLEAEARNNLCVALADLGRYPEALAECRAAEALRRPGGGPPLADTLNNLALTLEAAAEPDAARAAYLEALALYRAAGARQDEALVLANLASLAIAGADAGEALARIDEVERLARGAPDEPWAAEELRVARVNRAVAYERLGAYREALAELEGGAGMGGGDPRRAATLALNVAVLYRNLGDPWRALDELERARALVEPVGAGSLLASLALNRGMIRLLNLEEPEAARREFAAALELALAAGDRGEQSRARLGLGRSLLALGALDAAEEQFRAELVDAASTADAETRWRARAGLGRAAAARGRDADALAHFEAALAEVETVGRRAGDAGLAEGLRADQRALYAAAVDLLAGAGRAVEALAIAERSRALQLLDRLAGAGDGRPLGGTELERFGRERGGGTVAYFAGERRLWRFRLDGRGVVVDDAGAARELAADARAVHAALARGRAPGADHLTRLGSSLLAGLDAGGPLTIVPDGALFWLPFELLPVAPGATLLDRRAVSYAPSLSVLARLPATPARAARPLAAIADPGPATERTGTAALLAARFRLPPLPGARREAERAARWLGEGSVIDAGAEATEARFAERAREGARVLLIGAHTVIDERLERGVAVFLAPGAGGPGDDGLLEPAELAAMTIETDLAILSGCRTALGARPDGRSLASCSGALLAAGARGAVATLWEVEDRAAEALMDAFFWQLARGRRPAEALRAAKLRLARDPRWRGRLDWSAFVLIGDPPPVAPPAWRRPALLAAALVVAGAALALGARRLRAG